jgi:nicotinamidase-related amidase
MKTAMDAFELGYKPIVISDAVGSHGGLDLNEAALKILKRNIGAPQVIPTEEFLSETCSQ